MSLGVIASCRAQSHLRRSESELLTWVEEARTAEATTWRGGKSPNEATLTGMVGFHAPRSTGW